MSRSPRTEASAAFYKQVGKRVKRARLSLGLSQEALAAKLELTRTSITNIEQGRQRVMLHTIMDLAGALGVSLGDLVPTKSTDDRSPEDIAKAISDPRSQEFVISVLSHPSKANKR